MSLLLDENLSPRLIAGLTSLFQVREQTDGFPCPTIAVFAQAGSGESETLIASSVCPSNPRNRLADMLRLGLDRSQTALHTWSVLPLALLLALATVACVRREGRNSDCTWPGETLRHPGQAATVWHLSADAEFAEELADRYMITHYGPQSGHFVSFEVASEAEDRCLARLFIEVGRIHGVTSKQVVEVLRHNLYWMDMGESLSFLLAYAFAASLVTRRIMSRYPPANGWTEGIVLLMFCSLAFATGAVVVGENWIIAAESVRIWAGHLGGRAQRSFFAHHRIQLWGISLVLFWSIAVASVWRNWPRKRLLGL